MKDLVLLLLPFFFTACNVLQPVKDTSVTHLLDPTIPERTLTSSTPAIAIGRPALPSYLDRQQVVTRVGSGELKMSNFNLWAEPLDSAIARVTSVNLSRLTHSLNILPIDNFVSMDYASLLELRISQFESDANNHVVLNCTWKLQPVHGRPLQARNFRTEVPFNPETGTDISGRIAAMNECLARLSREIARSL
jgi:uncharacterized lipoprotein YmbA